MLPAPPMFRVCEYCSGLIEQFSLMSGNTFGATFWTDGKRDAPMLPDLQEFVKCPHCKSFLWINEQEELPLTDKEVDNLKTLLEMLDENNEHDRIMKAEIYRELGQFDDAMEMLNVIFDEEVAQAVSQIEGVCL